MQQIILLASLIFFVRPKTKKSKQEEFTQTIPECINTSAQTDRVRYPIKIENKTLRPPCFMKDKNRIHGDWILRKFFLKNKSMIYNRTTYELEINLTPRNILQKFGIKDVAGDFNNEYEEETYIIRPNDTLKVRNYPTFNYYMKIFIDGNLISKKLYSCNDDVIISFRNN